MVLKKTIKVRKIKYLKTKTGDNFSLTISKKAAFHFNNCCLYEIVEKDCIIFRSGCEPNEKNLDAIRQSIYPDRVRYDHEKHFKLIE